MLLSLVSFFFILTTGLSDLESHFCNFAILYLITPLILFSISTPVQAMLLQLSPYHSIFRVTVSFIKVFYLQLIRKLEQTFLTSPPENSFYRNNFVADSSMKVLLLIKALCSHFLVEWWFYRVHYEKGDDYACFIFRSRILKLALRI